MGGENASQIFFYDLGVGFDLPAVLTTEEFRLLSGFKSEQTR
jgi:hypothetical protein